EVSGLPRGSVARARIAPAAARRGVPPAPPIDAPVQADGSFFAEVPADTVLEIALLRPDGSTVASLHSGVWVRPGENRGCVGSHGSAGHAPPTHRPMALAPPAPSPTPSTATSPAGVENHASR